MNGLDEQKLRLIVREEFQGAIDNKFKQYGITPDHIVYLKNQYEDNRDSKKAIKEAFASWVIPVLFVGVVAISSLDAVREFIFKR